MEGRTALITGSTSGIGLATALLFASKGCNVILTGSGQRPQAEIDLIKQKFENYKVRCEYIAADLTKTDKVEELCKSVDQMFPDGIDILINNAGIQHVTPVEEFPLDKWNIMINCMLTAPFILTKHFLPGMKKKGFGRIINLSSVHGVVASPLKSAYCSAKHGLNGLTKVVALEAGGTGVTCNAICPGFVDTPLVQSQMQAFSKQQGLEITEGKKEFISKYHPSKEPIKEHHAADMCCFLCSESGSQMTGTSIMMDGGWTAR